MAADEGQRKLAAILAADVAGYSRLMTDDERATVRTLTEYRAVFSEHVAEHHGRIVDTAGDSVLATFDSVVEAVDAAVEVQRELAECNEALPAHRQMWFRIGVNLGDIIVRDDGTVYGDGVNVAARLESLAETGGVMMAEIARQAVGSKLDMAFEDIGEHTVKNIAEPIRVFRVRIADHDEKRPKVKNQSRSKSVTPDKPSIAVIPFTSMNSDPDQEFFADGMTEDIITALSRLRDFFVIARNTMFTYKDGAPEPNPTAIATDLGVRYVLEGSVRTSAKRVRITTQLTEAGTGTHLWGERYDRDLEDVFAIQDDIAASVVGCLQPQLYAAEHARFERKPPQSLDAWECFVRALFLGSQHSEESSQSALSLLNHAIELDGNYGQAYGLKAYSLVWRAFQSWEDMESAIEKATLAATRAIACDSQDPWAYVARGMVAVATRDGPEATNAFAHAIDLSPNFAYAHALLGATYAFNGRPEDAIACTDRAVKLSPRDTFSDDFQLYYAFAHFQAGRYDDAASFAEKAIQLRPEHPNSHVIAAASYALCDDLKKAADALDDLRILLPEVTATNVEQTWPFVLAEDRARLAQGLRKAGVPE